MIGILLILASVWLVQDTLTHDEAVFWCMAALSLLMVVVYGSLLFAAVVGIRSVWKRSRSEGVGVKDHRQPLHCWFSQQMWEQMHLGFDRTSARAFYLIDGQEREVTCASDTLEHGLGWPDVQYLGLGTYHRISRE